MNEAVTMAAVPDARAEALVASYERAGYVRLAPALLQPAEPFLDLSGEDIRRRMYLTLDPSGNELCLRPDLTIPVSRDYLASRRPASRRAIATSARCSATATRDRMNFCRPASNLSDAPTPRRPTRKCWRSAWKPRRITA